MDKLTFKCLECGKTKTIFGEINDIVECYVCGALMDLDKFEEVENGQGINHLADIIGIEKIQQEILTSGNDITWDRIENIFNIPEQRIQVRRLFFKAGGKVPEKELKI